MKNMFTRIVLIALVVALGVASLPIVAASAAGMNDRPAPGGSLSNERLEKIWARQLHRYERMKKNFDRADVFTEKVQGWLDRAKENGKDVSAIQEALNAFEAGLKNARPIYESTKGIVNSHQGFDANGKVVDVQKAVETVKVMREKLQAIKGAMNGTGKALHEAIRAFREANPKPG